MDKLFTLVAINVTKYYQNWLKDLETTPITTEVGDEEGVEDVDEVGVAEEGGDLINKLL